MDKNDWYQCGARIGDLVQSAIDSQDFKALNESITRTIEQTFSNISGKQPTYREPGTAYGNAKKDANLSDVVERFFTDGGFSVERNREQRAQSAGDVKTAGTLKGLFSHVVGLGLGGLFAFLGLIMVTGGAIAGEIGMLFPAAFFFILAAVFSVMGFRGRKYRKLAKRVRQYGKIMGDRDVVSLEELASGTGQSVEEVQKELREIIQEGMFASEAYIDTQGTTLMTSHSAYKQYQDTMKAYRQRQQQEEQEKQRASAAQAKTRSTEDDLASYSEETRTILTEGRDFITHIHYCNDILPEKEISDKLDRLEQVVTRIFAQVAAKPDSAPDLHKMMSYYLPITRKLVDAYVDLHDARIEGENVRRTREEIEKSLDTVNSAFETFLDSFYQDTAWDISSDISAMTTMMARDGLTGRGEFERVRQVAKDMNAAGTAAGSAAAAGMAGAAAGAGSAAAAGMAGAAAAGAGSAAAAGMAGAAAGAGGAAAAGMAGAAAMQQEER